MQSLFFSMAHAQSATEAAPKANIFESLLPLIIIFFIFYFLMIRPQKKRLQQEQSFHSALTKDQEVYTKSGILGTIRGLTDKVVTLEIGEGTRIKVLRSQIAGLSAKLFEPKNPVKK